jgi:hypothetical protein
MFNLSYFSTRIFAVFLKLDKKVCAGKPKISVSSNALKPAVDRSIIALTVFLRLPYFEKKIPSNFHNPDSSNWGIVGKV